MSFYSNGDDTGGMLMSKDECLSEIEILNGVLDEYEERRSELLLELSQLDESIGCIQSQICDFQSLIT